jgi:hypothetical protein
MSRSSIIILAIVIGVGLGALAGVASGYLLNNGMTLYARILSGAAVGLIAGIVATIGRKATRGA